MTKKYEKWRDLSIGPVSIKFKNIILKEMISYRPKGHDVVECTTLINNSIKNAFIKI